MFTRSTESFTVRIQEQGAEKGQRVTRFRLSDPGASLYDLCIADRNLDELNSVLLHNETGGGTLSKDTSR